MAALGLSPCSPSGPSQRMVRHTPGVRSPREVECNQRGSLPRTLCVLRTLPRDTGAVRDRKALHQPSRAARELQRRPRAAPPTRAPTPHSPWPQRRGRFAALSEANLSAKQPCFDTAACATPLSEFQRVAFARHATLHGRARANARARPSAVAAASRKLLSAAELAANSWLRHQRPLDLPNKKKTKVPYVLETSVSHAPLVQHGKRQRR